MQLELQDLRWPIQGDVRVVPTLYVPTYKSEPGKTWTRRICMSGQHRRTALPMLGDCSREEIEADVLRLDRLPVGSIIQIVSWTFMLTDKAETVAFARLVSRSTNGRFVDERGHYYVQAYQTLKHLRNEQP